MRKSYAVYKIMNIYTTQTVNTIKCYYNAMMTVNDRKEISESQQKFPQDFRAS